MSEKTTAEASPHEHFTMLSPDERQKAALELINRGMDMLTEDERIFLLKTVKHAPIWK